MEVLACMTRKNKLIHASESSIGPEKLVLSWVRTIVNSRMKMVKFCLSSQNNAKHLSPRLGNKQINKSQKNDTKQNGAF